MAATLNIEIDQGATYSKTLTLTDSVGSPLDLTNVTEVRGQVRKKINDIDPSATFTMAVSGTPTLGVISWELSAALSSAMKPGIHVYDVEIQYSDGRVTRVVEGEAIVKQNVTR